jgi:hypothetical protein
MGLFNIGRMVGYSIINGYIRYFKPKEERAEKKGMNIMV